MFISDAQLAGGLPAMAVRMSDALDRASIAHIGNPFTSWRKAVTSSRMQAE